MRRFDRKDGGHTWAESDAESYDSSGEGPDPFRKAALRFLQKLEPADVYAVDTGPNTVVIYYRTRQNA